MCTGDNIHDVKKHKSVGNSEPLRMAEETTSECTEEEKVAVEQLTELQRIREISSHGHDEDRYCYDNNDDDDDHHHHHYHLDEANEDSNSDLDTCQGPSRSSIDFIDLSHVSQSDVYARKPWPQHKDSYVVSRGSCSITNQLDVKSMVKLEDRKGHKDFTIVDESTDGMILNRTHERGEHDDHESTHYREDANFDARPRKKIRFLTDIYRQKRRQDVSQDIAEADRESVSICQKKLPIKRRRKSLSKIMREA